MHWIIGGDAQATVLIDVCVVTEDISGGGASPQLRPEALVLQMQIVELWRIIMCAGNEQNNWSGGLNRYNCYMNGKEKKSDKLIS